MFRSSYAHKHTERLNYTIHRKKMEDKSKKETYNDHESLRFRARQTTHQTAAPTIITIASA